MARSITKVETGVIKNGTITLSKFAATGTASSSTVLYGNMAWASGAPSGKRDFTDTNATPTAGDVWFESSQLQFAIDPSSSTGVWVTGGNLLQARRGLAASGTQKAGLCFGGWSGSAVFTNTERYNGTVWIAADAMGTGRSYLSGCGTYSAALSIGGGPAADNTVTEE